MKGNNTFNFNQATMIEAMQFYLDAQLKAKVKVVAVRSARDCMDGYQVEVEEATEGLVT